MKGLLMDSSFTPAVILPTTVLSFGQVVERIATGQDPVIAVISWASSQGLSMVTVVITAYLIYTRLFKPLSKRYNEHMKKIDSFYCELHEFVTAQIEYNEEHKKISEQFIQTHESYRQDVPLIKDSLKEVLIRIRAKE